jgi:hypothetical protein
VSVAYVGEMKNAHRNLVRHLKKRDHSGDIIVDGKDTLLVPLQFTF